MRRDSFTMLVNLGDDLISCSRSFRRGAIRYFERPIAWREAHCLCIADIHCFEKPTRGIFKCRTQIRQVVLVERNSGIGMIDFRFDCCDYKMDSVSCAGKKNCSIPRKGCQIVNFAPIKYVATFQNFNDFGQKCTRELRFRIGFDLFDRRHYVTSSSSETKRYPHSGQSRSIEIVSHLLLILPNRNCKRNDDSGARASCNYRIYYDTRGVHVHPCGCARPFELARDEMRRQAPNSKRQQCDGTEFGRSAQSYPVIHAFPIFDFRGIVARVGRINASMSTFPFSYGARATTSIGLRYLDGCNSQLDAFGECVQVHENHACELHHLASGFCREFFGFVKRIISFESDAMSPFLQVDSNAAFGKQFVDALFKPPSLDIRAVLLECDFKAAAKHGGSGGCIAASQTGCSLVECARSTRWNVLGRLYFFGAWKNVDLKNVVERVEISRETEEVHDFIASSHRLDMDRNRISACRAYPKRIPFVGCQRMRICIRNRESGVRRTTVRAVADEGRHV